MHLIHTAPNSISKSTYRYENHLCVVRWDVRRDKAQREDDANPAAQGAVNARVLKHNMDIVSIVPIVSIVSIASKSCPGYSKQNMYLVNGDFAVQNSESGGCHAHRLPPPPTHIE